MKAYFIKYVRNKHFKFRYMKTLNLIFLLIKFSIIGMVSFLLYFSTKILKKSDSELKEIFFDFSSALFFLFFSSLMINTYIDNFLSILEATLVCYLIDIEMFVGI